MKEIGHLRMYTDGEVFRISIGEDTLVLTKEEMLKALIFFSPYFTDHVFGIVADVWEDA